MVLELLRNEWIVNIGAAIISGIFLIPITIVLGSWIDNSNKKKNAEKVNKEVISIIKKIVSEGQNVDFTLVKILTDSVKRSNKTDNKFVYSELQMIEHVITDIFDSSYLTMQKKVEMARPLKEVVTDWRESPVHRKSSSSLSKSTYYVYLGAFFLLVMLTIFTVVSEEPSNVSNEINPNRLTFIFVALISFFGGLLVYMRLTTKKSFIKLFSDFFGLSEYEDNDR